MSREQVARFIQERVAQLSSLQTPRVNKGPMREKRESPSLVAMRASGALAMVRVEGGVDTTNDQVPY